MFGYMRDRAALVVFRRFHALALLIGQRSCLINVKDLVGFEVLIKTTLEKQIAKSFGFFDPQNERTLLGSVRDITLKQEQGAILTG